MEKGNHALEQVASPAYDEDEGSVGFPVPIIGDDTAASENRSILLEYSSSLRVLAYPELRNELEPETRIGASCHPNRKGSFSIGESAQIGFQPSLLIVRVT